jgi:dTDP-glucose pyrophosphorylase
MVLYALAANRSSGDSSMSQSHESIWRKAVLTSNVTLGDAIRNLNEVAIKIVLVADEVGVLVGTISDGDIRRALLKGLILSSPISSAINYSPLVASPDIGRTEIMRLMALNKVQQIPIVDPQHRVVGLHLWSEIVTPSPRRNLMVIMAGGEGVRLRPHTENCPKPMLSVGGKPILEHIIERAKQQGFRNFAISVRYLGHMIEAHLGDGSRLGVNIVYLRESEPLGTAGALGLLHPFPDAPFVVTNGDVITGIRYGELLDFHTQQNAVATMAIRLHEWQHPFGVVQTSGVEIIGFEEKPITRTYINAGVYALDPRALAVLPSSTRCDMPALFQSLQSRSQRIIAYTTEESWSDVGRPEDLTALELNHKKHGLL